jgi:hypothetical protein
LPREAADHRKLNDRCLAAGKRHPFIPPQATAAWSKHASTPFPSMLGKLAAAIGAIGPGMQSSAAGARLTAPIGQQSEGAKASSAHRSHRSDLCANDASAATKALHLSPFPKCRIVISPFNVSRSLSGIVTRSYRDDPMDCASQRRLAVRFPSDDPEHRLQIISCGIIRGTTTLLDRTFRGR